MNSKISNTSIKLISNVTLYYTYLKEARHVFPYVSNICKVSKNNNIIHHLIICGVSSFGVIHPPFSFSARGSLMSMAKIFQSVSPVGKKEYFNSLSLSLSLSLHTLINECHCSQYLDLDDLSPLGDPVANFTYIQGVIVSLGPCVRVNVARVLPRLWQSPIVPDIAMIGKTVVDKAQLVLLDVLLNGVQLLGGVYLNIRKLIIFNYIGCAPPPRHKLLVLNDSLDIFHT